jgi:UDP-glucose 4-epimerase
VIPLFREQIRAGGPVTITTTEMTRFLLTLNEAVDTMFAALRGARRGETYIPRVPAAKVTDIAAVLVGNRSVETRVVGIRPGEKVHEVLVSEEECHRTTQRDGWYVIAPILPELQSEPAAAPLGREYNSGDHVVGRAELASLLGRRGLLLDSPDAFEEDLLV